jgi:Co/Zn/Cd efflux system component
MYFTGAPDQFTYDEVKGSLESIDGVTHVHSLRLWSLTVDLLAANVHLQISKFLKRLINFTILLLDRNQ